VSQSNEGHDQQRMIVVGKCQEGGVVRGARRSRCNGRIDLNQNDDCQWPGESSVSSVGGRRKMEQEEGDSDGSSKGSRGGKTR